MQGQGLHARQEAAQLLRRQPPRSYRVRYFPCSRSHPLGRSQAHAGTAAAIPWHAAMRMQAHPLHAAAASLGQEACACRRKSCMQLPAPTRLGITGCAVRRPHASADGSCPPCARRQH
jgi:hypothetical protein